MITLAWYTFIFTLFCMIESIVRPFETLFVIVLLSPTAAFSGIFIFKHYKEIK
jgi:hypothetical protein